MATIEQQHVCIHCQWRLNWRDVLRRRCPECGNPVAVAVAVKRPTMGVRDAANGAVTSFVAVTFFESLMFTVVDSGSRHGPDPNWILGILLQTPLACWVLFVSRFRRATNATPGWIRRLALYHLIMFPLILAWFGLVIGSFAGAFVFADRFDRIMRFDLGILVGWAVGALLIIAFWRLIARPVYRLGERVLCR